MQCGSKFEGYNRTVNPQHLVILMLNIVFELVAELMPSATLYIWAQSDKLTSQKKVQIRPRFFSFNSSATLFWTA